MEDRSERRVAFAGIDQRNSSHVCASISGGRASRYWWRNIKAARDSVSYTVEVFALSIKGLSRTKPTRYLSIKGLSRTKPTRLHCTLSGREMSCIKYTFCL